VSEDIRNRVRVVYGTPQPTKVKREPRTLWERVIYGLFGHYPAEMRMMRPTAEARDMDSIIRYGERLAVVECGEITSEVDANVLAEQMLHDLSSGTPEGHGV
jgi:hypothetical protein